MATPLQTIVFMPGDAPNRERLVRIVADLFSFLREGADYAL